MSLNRLMQGVVASLIAVAMTSCGYIQSRRDGKLIAAIQTGSPDGVRHALHVGGNPNALINDGATTPLLFAIATKTASATTRKGIINALLSAGADPSKRQKDGIDALYLAANIGDAELCAHFCKEGMSPMRPAFRGTSAMHIAAINGDVSCLSAMLPFVKADQIDATSSVEDHMDSALGMACTNDHWDAAKLLLEHGANPNFQGGHGMSPLMSATILGDIDLVNLLLSHNVKVDLGFENGGTALSFASLGGNLNVMRVLIAHGADVNHQNKGGVTPMMDAAKEGHQEAVDLLLKAGARPDLRDKNGFTAADYLQQHQKSKTNHPASEPTEGRLER